MANRVLSALRRTNRARSLARRPRLDLLENRLLLTTFLVTNTNDEGPGSLRQAILDSNAQDSSNVIDFYIDGSGVQTIAPTSSLPGITEPVDIDGYSQPGASPNSLAVGENAKILIQLSGSDAPGSDGLSTGAAVTIRGLAIDGFMNNTIGQGGSGLFLNSADDVIVGNFLGTDPTGLHALPNLINGIRSLGTSATIGGTSAADRNIISGNSGEGIEFFGGSTGLVEGNYIGVDATGGAALGNGDSGVVIGYYATGDTIGGTDPGAGNVISGNSNAGVQVLGNQEVLEGNRIGTNASGTAALPNGGDGILLNGGTSNDTIGGSAIGGAGNVISGNSGDGILDSSGSTGSALWLQGEGNADDTYLGHDGAAVGDVSYTTSFDPADGRAFSFDGNGYVSVPDSPVLDSPTITLEAWVNPSTVGSANSTIVSKEGMDGSGQVGYGFRLRSTGAFWFAIGSDGSDEVATSANDGVYASAGQWYHLVGTYDSTTGEAQLYVNGTLVDRESFSPVAITSTSPLEIGALPGNGSEDFRGAVDDVAVYDRILSSDDVATLDSDPIAIRGVDQLQGNTISGNGGDGVQVSGASNLLIGGVGDASGNQIVSNDGDGIDLDGAENITVRGNRIGTDGTRDLGNSTGIDLIDSATGNRIGGTLTGSGNVISGNAGDGVLISGGGASFNVVAGNLIGLDETGTKALPNAGQGVEIDDGATGNTLGGLVATTIAAAVAGARNVISGNSASGVSIHDSGTSANVVIGNYLGTDISGTIGVGNLGLGIDVELSASGNVIGGSVAGAGNLISDNQSGIAVGTSAVGTVIQGNLIGTDRSGALGLGNGIQGIVLASSGTTVGGSTAAARNVISANAFDQINIYGGSNNLVVGNYIGTDASGSANFSTGGDGIDIQFSTATGNTIGGPTSTPGTGLGNVISGNLSNGIGFFNGDPANNLIEGNLIGLAAGGSAILADAVDGIYEGVGSGNTIGGATSSARNVISGNGHNGVEFATAGTSANLIAGDYIGTNLAGAAAEPNAVAGVVIDQGALFNTIGGSSSTDGNVISGNSGEGVIIRAATLNLVAGNDIGTNLAGAAVPNTSIGVLVEGGSTGNTIGGAGDGAANRIAFNDGAGVAITGSSSVENSIVSNQIHDNSGLGIDLGDDGVTPDASGGARSGPNNLQNYPVLTSVTTDYGVTTIAGTLQGAPNATYTIEFFANPTADASGYGQGGTFVGSTSVTTDSTGNGTFSAATNTPLALNSIVSATATDGSGDTSEFSADVTNLAAMADLALTITAAPEPVQVGQDLVYTITVTNNGPNAATDVAFTDTLPAGVTYVSSSGNSSFAGGVVTGLIGSLASGAFTSYSLIVIPTVATAPGAPLANSATASAHEGDPVAGNNSGTADSTVIPSADLSVTVAANPTGPVLVGQALTYTITVVNNGPSTASNVVLGDTLPIGLTVVYVTLSGGFFTRDGQQVTATLGSLAATATATISITVLPTLVGQATNTVGVSSNTADPLLGNNQASIISNVAAAPTTTTLVSSTPSTVYGQSVTFTATVSANSPSTATPSGTVQFLADGVDLGRAVALVNGSASLATSLLGAGVQAITAIYSGGTNFLAGSPASSTQKVARAALSITAGDQSKTFGATLDLGNTSFTTIGLQNNETVGSVTLTSPGTLATTPTGSYAISPSAATGGTFNASNYAITYFAGILGVNAATTTTTLTSSNPSDIYGASLTFTATVSANSPSTAIPSGTVQFLADGVDLGRAVALVNGSATLATSLLGAGVHAITATYSGDANDQAGSPASYTQGVAKASLLVAADPQQKTYGQADPALTFTTGPLQNGDTSAIFTGSLSRAPGKGVAGGPYAIGQGTLSAGSNYAIQFTGASLTIAPYALSVYANPQQKLYGQADPALTYTYQPLQNGDTASVFTGSLSRAPGEGVAGGPYAIGQGTLSAGSNYAIQFTGSSLKISGMATTGTLATSTSATNTGDLVSITANVGVVAPGTGVPTGLVQFKVDSSDFGSPVPLVNGRAVIVDGSLSVGLHLISASYLGAADLTFQPSLIASGSVSITTLLAGTGVAGFADTTPDQPAQFDLPSGLAIDSRGDIYVADTNNDAVRMISPGPDPIVTTLFKNSSSASAGPQLSRPTAVAVDLFGDVFVASPGNNSVFAISNGRLYTVLDGSDGLNQPGGVAVDPLGRFLYVADTGNNRVLVVDLTGGSPWGSTGPSSLLATPDVVAAGGSPTSAGTSASPDDPSPTFSYSVIAGTGVAGLGSNGPAALSELDQPTGLALDPRGDLLIADTNNNRIQEVTTASGDGGSGAAFITPADGMISTILGQGADPGSTIVAPIDHPVAVALGSIPVTKTIHIGDETTTTTSAVSTLLVTQPLTSQISVLALGTSNFATIDAQNSPGAVFQAPAGIVFTADGAAIVAGTQNNQIFSISASFFSSFSSESTPTDFASDADAAISVLISSSSSASPSFTTSLTLATALVPLEPSSLALSASLSTNVEISVEASSSAAAPPNQSGSVSTVDLAEDQEAPEENAEKQNPGADDAAGWFLMGIAPSSSGPASTTPAQDTDAAPAPGDEGMLHGDSPEPGPPGPNAAASDEAILALDAEEPVQVDALLLQEVARHDFTSWITGLSVVPVLPVALGVFESQRPSIKKRSKAGFHRRRWALPKGMLTRTS